MATNILIAIAGLCAVWYVVTTLLIYQNLRLPGQQVSFLWLRVMAPWYASRYRKVTMTETGRVGPLFYHWVVSINLALLCAVVALILYLLEG